MKNESEVKNTGCDKDWSFTLNNYTKEEKMLFKRWSSEVAMICITKEVGEQGTPHLQGRIIFKRSYTWKLLHKLIPRAFWEKTKARQDSLYMLKVGSRPFIDVDNRKQGKRTDLDAVIIDIKKGSTKKKLWENHANTMIRYHKGMYEAMKHLAPKDKHVIEYNIDCFKPWEEITEWDKMIIIIGDSGIGKTEFAKAHFQNPLIVSHMDDLAELNEDFDGIIFDDMDFKHIPRTAQIHICDVSMTRSIHIRYGLATIPKKMKRVITCNELPLHLEDKAINRRCKVVTLKSRLK